MKMKDTPPLQDSPSRTRVITVMVYEVYLLFYQQSLVQTNRTRLSSSLLNKVSTSNFFFLFFSKISMFVHWLHTYTHTQPIYYFIGNAQTFINKYH